MHEQNIDSDEQLSVQGPIGLHVNHVSQCVNSVLPSISIRAQKKNIHLHLITAITATSLDVVGNYYGYKNSHLGLNGNTGGTCCPTYLSASAYSSGKPTEWNAFFMQYHIL